MLNSVEEIEAWRAKKALIKKIACELLEQCAGEGFTYLDVKNVCETAKTEARNRAFIHPREEKS